MMDQRRKRMYALFMLIINMYACLIGVVLLIMRENEGRRKRRRVGLDQRTFVRLQVRNEETGRITRSSNRYCATGHMAESASDALDGGVNLYEDAESSVEPFPSVDPFAPVNSTKSAQSGHGASSTSSKKRKRDAKKDELVNLIAKGCNGSLEACAEVKNLIRTDMKVNDTRECLSDELVELGLSHEEVINALLKLGSRSDLLLVWASLKHTLKKDFVMKLLKE